MYLLRHQSLSGERRSCGALWGRDWTFTSIGLQEPRPPRHQSQHEVECHWTNSESFFVAMRVNVGRSCDLA